MTKSKFSTNGKLGRTMLCGHPAGQEGRTFKWIHCANNQILILVGLVVLGLVVRLGAALHLGSPDWVSG
jgi:hypothetical protein